MAPELSAGLEGVRSDAEDRIPSSNMLELGQRRVLIDGYVRAGSRRKLQVALQDGRKIGDDHRHRQPSPRTPALDVENDQTLRSCERRS